MVKDRPEGDPSEPGTSPVPEAVLDAAHDNLVSYMRLLATTSAGGEVDEGDGYLAFAGAHEYPGTYTNGVIRTRQPGRPPTTPAEILARADAFFGRLRRPFVAWTRSTQADRDLDSELLRRGCFLRPPATGSEAVLRFNSPLDLGPPIPGVDIVETDDENDYRDYLLLVARVYGFSDVDLALAEGVLFSINSLRHPGSHVFVARLRDTGAICGGTTTYIDHGVAHSAWSVTDPEVRGRGIGRALVPYSARGAYALGAEFVWGVSSQVGAPIWNSVGFQTVTRYKRFVVPMPEAPPTPAHGGRGSARARRRRAPE